MGLFCYNGTSVGRGSFGGSSDILMSCSCREQLSWWTIWCPDVLFLTRWPCQVKGHWTGEEDVWWCHPSIDADVGARWDAMCPKVSWGSLDQDNTSCLFWGIPDLENLRCGATGVHWCSDFDDALVFNVSSLVVMANRLFYSSVLM